METAGLSVVCNGFGYREEDVDGTLLGYVKSDSCLDNLKDLQRFLRRDDPVGRSVFKQICKWNVVSRDLIPILENHPDDRNLVVNIVKVLVFLTMPVDPASENIPQQTEYLWKLKTALTRSTTIAIIVSLLEAPLEHLQGGEFTEDDWKLVQLLLTLFRNVLAIKDILLQQKACGSSTQYLYIRERFLELLFSESVTDLILVLAENVNEPGGYLRQDNLLLLEIFHYIFQGHEPETIAKAPKKNSEVIEGVSSAINSLKSIMEEEEEKTRLIRLRTLEQSSLGGTFTRTTIDGSKTLFKGNPVAGSTRVLLKNEHIQRGPLKKIAWDTRGFSLSKDSVLELLHNFLNTFLSGGYNVLMQSIHEDIANEHDLVQGGDVMVFFQVACFATAFQRHKFISCKSSDFVNTEASTDDAHIGSSFVGNICGPVAATMNEGMMFLVITKWRDAFESLKQTGDYKSMSSSGSLMKNMIRMLDLIFKLLPENSSETRVARILLYKVFYDQTDQGFTRFLLNQLNSFDNQKQPKSDLVDLVEIMHVMLRLIESLQAHGVLRVSKKSRKGRKKKTTTVKNISEVGKKITRTVPCLDNEICDEEKQSSLLNGDFVSTSVELEGASSPKVPDVKLPESAGLENDDSETLNADPDSLPYESGDSSNDDDPPATSEVDFNISKLVSEFASSSAVENLCWLLKFCKTNAASTNHYVLCMLQRICYDLELSPLLYQLSSLTIFYDILADESTSNRCPDVTSFLRKLVRGLMKKIKRQPLLLVDILFWKTRKECHLINAEGLIDDLKNMKKNIRELHGKETMDGSSSFEHVPRRSLADALGEDDAEIDGFENFSNNKENLSTDCNQDIGGRAHQGQKENMPVSNSSFEESTSSLDNNQRDKSSQEDKGRPKKVVLDKEHDGTIQNLYEKFKDEKRCSHLIAEALDLSGKISPLQVSSRLRKLGLQVSSKRKNRRDFDNVPTGDDQMRSVNDEVDESTPQSTNRLEDAHLNSSSHRRKRVRAFSKEDESTIKTLFESFKNHKRCSYMIAQALNTDHPCTSAQVSRKLKQLGLVPQKNPSSKDVNVSRLDEFSGKDTSDEETLSLMLERERKRKATKVDAEAAVIEGSQQDPAEFGCNEDRSDDEPLNTIFKKRQKGGTMDTPMKSLTDPTTDDVRIETGLYAVDRNSGDPTRTQVGNIDNTVNIPIPVEGNLDDGVNEGDVINHGHPSSFHHDASQYHQGIHQYSNMKELEDSSDDDLGKVAPKIMHSKRKMAIAFEDDD